MRLSDEEVQAIVKSVKEFLPNDFKGQLVLFGSQTRLDAKGGDIDLALLVLMPQDKVDQLKMQDYKMVAAMKMKSQIGDRKIDFNVISEEDSNKAFFREALKGAVVLF